MSGRRTAMLALALAMTVGACMRGRRSDTVLVRPRPTADVPADTITPIRVDSVLTRVAGAPAESAFVAAGPPARAAERPAERCLLEVDGDRSQFIKDPISEKYTSYFGGGFTGRCPVQGLTIIADSAEFYDQNQLYFLIGNVKYREPRVRVDADRMTYYRAEERLLAEGNVVAVGSDSSTMRGPRAEYFRAVRGVRLRPRMVATMRPTLTLYEADSAGQRSGEPVLLIADQINGEGDSLFVAWGAVQLDRSDLLARGDSATLDNHRQFSRLMKQPFIESKGEERFTLRGLVLDLYGRNRAVERVVALDSAVAVSQDLTLASDTIDLRISDNRLQRAFAFGPGAASAVTPERTIIADSLDVRMPDQRIRELYAIRSAYAESDPDSTKVRSAERDWLRGDTIVARFDSVSAGDTASRPRIRDLLASGSAQSFYQVPNSKGVGSPGINYVRGRQIVVDFRDQDVQTVTVVDSASGLYLEAVPDTVTGAPPASGRRPARPRGAPASRTPNAVRRP